MSVFIHSVGTVSPLGSTWQATADALALGRTAIAPIVDFDTTGFPCTVAASMSGANARADRRIPLMLQALAQVQHSIHAGRIGVFIGAESGLARFINAFELSRVAGGDANFDHDRFANNIDEALLAAIAEPRTSAASVADSVARHVNATGPIETISLACASSSAALVQASRALKLGECDVAICGGVGADVDPIMLAAFSRLGAVSVRGQSCPFDVRRDGFVLGEGAVAMVLSRERMEPAIEIAGTGMTLDAHHLTTPDSDGDGAIRAMRIALTEAKLDGVDYVQAHGTSTPVGDMVEAKAIRIVLNPTTPVGAVKGALGHWIAGAGALSIACAWEAVANSRLLPTVGLQTPDSEYPLNHVQHRAQDVRARTAMANAFGFGGANCSVILRRCDV